MNAYQLKVILDEFFDELGEMEMKKIDVYSNGFRNEFNLLQRVKFDEDGDLILRGIVHDND